MKTETPKQRKIRYQKEKARDLIRWSYITFKANAKRRGKAFSITLDEFREFCYNTSLLTNRGVKSTSYTIDRINNDYGYHTGNIQKMELGHNVKKRFEYDYHSKRVSYQHVNNLILDEYPF